MRVLWLFLLLIQPQDALLLSIDQFLLTWSSPNLWLLVVFINLQELPVSKHILGQDGCFILLFLLRLLVLKVMFYFVSLSAAVRLLTFAFVLFGLWYSLEIQTMSSFGF